MESQNEQQTRLEELRKAYFDAKTSGAADTEAKRNAYFEYAAEIVEDLSGVLEPGADKDPMPGPITGEGQGGGTANEPPKPTEGFIKDGGGWGADQNPTNWHVVPMKDDPKKFKIVDNAGKNVATDFTSEANAQAYITYSKWQYEQHQQPGSGSPGTTPTGGDVDQFGIKCIKASVPNGRVETDFKLVGKKRNYQSGKPSEYSCEYTNAPKQGIQNVEVTIYEKINGFKTKEADTISLKMGGPPHTNGPGKSWLIAEIMTDGSAKKTFQTEYPHPEYHPVDPAPFFKIGESIVGKWIGYKCTSQQTKDGKRHCETWIHFPVTDINNVKNEQDKWRQYISVDIPDKRFYEISGTLTTSRLDGVEEKSLPDFKYASVREITAVQ